MDLKAIGGIRGIIMLFLIMIGIPAAILIGNQKMIDYKTNGIEVTATVVNVESMHIGKKIRHYVTVTYTDPNGQLITANAINADGAVMNQSIYGRVLPGVPNEVFLEPAPWVLVVVYGLAIFFFLAGAFLIFGMFYRARTDEKLSRMGTVTDALILNRIYIGDSQLIEVTFKDERGIVRKVECCPPPYLPQNATECTVRYVVKSEKKVICEVV